MPNICFTFLANRYFCLFRLDARQSQQKMRKLFLRRQLETFQLDSKADSAILHVSLCSVELIVATAMLEEAIWAKRPKQND